MNLQTIRHEVAFWFHLFVTLLAWVAPFWFSWFWVIPVYAAVMLQYVIFGGCLMNGEHGLVEEDDATFYSYLLGKLGLHWSRSRIKFYVRRVLYPVLSVVAIVWQEVMEIPPVFF